MPGARPGTLMLPQRIAPGARVPPEIQRARQPPGGARAGPSPRAPLRRILHASTSLGLWNLWSVGTTGRDRLFWDRSRGSEVRQRAASQAGTGLVWYGAAARMAVP